MRDATSDAVTTDVQTQEDKVVTAAPSFSPGRVDQPEHAGVTVWLHWHRPRPGGMFVSVAGCWAGVEPGSCLAENPGAQAAIEKTLQN